MCNPSIVLDSDQEGVAPGQARFVMSLRGIGEGHVSCIEFRTVVAGESASFVLESLPARFTPAQLDRALADLEAQIVTHSSVDPFRRRPAMPISVL